MIFKWKDRVIWRYIHHLNSKSAIVREKEGVFQGNIKHTVKHKGKQLAGVLFDGNKRESRVPVDELIRYTPTK